MDLNFTSGSFDEYLFIEPPRNVCRTPTISTGSQLRQLNTEVIEAYTAGFGMMQEQFGIYVVKLR